MYWFLVGNHFHLPALISTIGSAMSRLLDRVVCRCYDLFDPGLRYNHFAFVVKRNRIVSVGRNRPFKTHPLCRAYRFESIHAEVDAVLRARCGDFKFIPVFRGFKLICVRIRRGGGLGLARPCSLCWDFVCSVGFDDVIFSSEDGWVSCSC